MNTQFDVTPLSTAAGVEVHGVEPDRAVTVEQAEALRQLLDEHLVLLIRGTIGSEQQIQIVSAFGPVTDEREDGSRHSYISNVRSDTLIKDERLPYHADFTYSAHPHLVLSLYGEQVVPPAAPTLFANRVLAAATLPSGLRRRLDGVSVVHARDLTPEHRGDYARLRLADLPEDAPESLYPRTTHPALKPHPRTGRPMLFICEHFTSHFAGMSDGESEALYSEALTHLLRPEHTFAHQWRQGDLLIWDNLAVVHARQNLSGTAARTLRRVSINSRTVAEMYAGVATRKTGLSFTR